MSKCRPSYVSPSQSYSNSSSQTYQGQKTPASATLSVDPDSDVPEDTSECSEVYNIVSTNELDFNTCLELNLSTAQML